MALQSALEAAEAALPDLLDTQHKLAAQHTSTTASAVPVPEFYAGCDPAAAASITAAAKPRVARIFSSSNADMSRVQRDAALREAKEEVIKELTQNGIYRFSVGVLIRACCWHSLSQNILCPEDSPDLACDG